jgi:RNA polymerase sigma factor (sigma-70 family)
MFQEENKEFLPFQAYEGKLKDLEDVITDEKLLQSFSLLTVNQKTILRLAYIEQLKDIEIAEIFNKSQQTISRSHQNALNKIRKTLNDKK